ncbi:MAG: hypothetical protein PHG27_12970 [Massilibacteroides sp.]|nr:hypothetical protein [Massilibacteroides sp.]MDD4661142.1 hypothetical protein [Massilibacteroides sp.]
MGKQTITLAQNAPKQITELDLFRDFTNIFNRNVKQLGLHSEVKGIIGSMLDTLPFENKFYKRLSPALTQFRTRLPKCRKRDMFLS